MAEQVALVLGLLASSCVFAAGNLPAGYLSTGQSVALHLIPCRGGLFGTHSASIQLGSTKQVALALFDSRLRESWFATIDCRDCSYDQGHYDPAASTSHKSLDREVTLKTQDGSTVSGKLGVDDLTIGDIVLPQVQLVEASQVGRAPADGVFGIGLERQPGANMSSAYEQLIGSHILKAPVLSFWIAGDSIGDGELEIGDIDPIRYFGQLVEVPVERGSWFFPIESIGDESAQLGNVCPTGGHCRAMVATGQGQISGPAAAIRAINEAMGAVKRGERDWQVDCKPQGKPTLSFRLGSVSFVFEPKHYLLGSFGRPCWSIFVENGPEDSENWYLGTTFIRRVFSVFDGLNEMMSFAYSANQLGFD